MKYIHIRKTFPGTKSGFDVLYRLLTPAKSGYESDYYEKFAFKIDPKLNFIFRSNKKNWKGFSQADGSWHKVHKGKKTDRWHHIHDYKCRYETQLKDPSSMAEVKNLEMEEEDLFLFFL